VTFIGDLFQVVPMLTDKIHEYKEKNGLLSIKSVKNRISQ
jgi:hypothetical protein